MKRGKTGCGEGAGHISVALRDWSCLGPWPSAAVRVRPASVARGVVGVPVDLPPTHEETRNLTVQHVLSSA